MTVDKLYTNQNNSCLDALLYGGVLPTNAKSLFGGYMQKHKVFISYKHKNTPLLDMIDDSYYKRELENAGTNVFINKSVQNGDIDSENKDTYIKRLIQEEHISDTSVIIVLIGPETWSRKYIDWEISAGLDNRVGNSQAGLIGILLPNHPNYSSFSLYQSYNYLNFQTIPSRLHSNVTSGYAKIYPWGEWVKNPTQLKVVID